MSSGQQSVQSLVFVLEVNAYVSGMLTLALDHLLALPANTAVVLAGVIYDYCE